MRSLYPKHFLSYENPLLCNTAFHLVRLIELLKKTPSHWTVGILCVPEERTSDVPGFPPCGICPFMVAVDHLIVLACLKMPNPSPF